jgi:transposase InsO family protein
MAIKEAYENRHPEKGLILHNDRGMNYQSVSIEKYLAALGILHSFSAPHSPHDNAVMESFFSTLKREELYRRDYRSEREFFEALDKYVSFYNDFRPIKMFQYRTPAKRESEYYSKSKASE